MTNEFKIFLTALSFYTRVPVGNIKGWNEGLLNKSTRYFPVIGLLVGGIGAFFFWILGFYFPVSIAVALSMVVTILFTGAFHEDGFADFCDGFGGGYTPERILEIMKDSRIGTYGSIGLMAVLGVKFLVLTHVELARIPFILISGHAISRIFPVLLIYTSQYARLDASSKGRFHLFIVVCHRYGRNNIVVFELAGDRYKHFCITSGCIFLSKLHHPKTGRLYGRCFGSIATIV